MINQSVDGRKSCAVSRTKKVSIHLLIERFSIEWRKTKTKVITNANKNNGKYHKDSMRTQSKYMQTTSTERGKTQVTKSRLVLVLLLIGWEGSASFLD